jgi:hypothetical protein
MIPLLLSVLLTLPAAAAPASPPAQTLKDWVFVRTQDGGTYAVPRDQYEAAAAAATKDHPGTTKVYAMTFAPNSIPDPRIHATVKPVEWTLRVYPKGPAGVPTALCRGADCGKSGTDVEAHACPPESCPGLRFSHPMLKAYGSAINPKEVTRPLMVDDAKGDPVIGSEKSLMAQLTPARRLALQAVKESDPKVYKNIVSFWVSGYGPDANLDTRLQAYLKDPKIAVKWTGKGKDRKPDVLGSLNPIDRAYIESLPKKERDAVIAKAGAAKDGKAAAEFLLKVHSVVAGNIEPPKNASAKKQLEATAASLTGAKSAADLKKSFDGAQKIAKTTGDKTHGDAVDATGPSHKDPTKLINAKSRIGDVKLDAKGAVPDLKPGQDGAAPGTVSKTLGAIGGFLKKPAVAAGGGLLIGGLMGFAMGGPIGAMIGGILGVVFGSGLAGMF